MIKKCSNCYWCQEKGFAAHEEKGSIVAETHTGCYARGKWRKWIPKKAVDIPNECLDWKEIPEIP